MSHSHDDHWGRPYAPEFSDAGGRPPRGRGRGRGRRRGFGGGPGLGPPPGFGSPPGFGPGGRGRGRQRGDVRVAILILLDEQPRHGYDLIRAIEERTDGAWSPSPGSVYPTLQSLVDEGLITMSDVDGRNVATITDEGRDWIAEREDAAAAVFERPSGGRSHRDLTHEIRKIYDAAVLVERQNDGDTAAAIAVLAKARKYLYGLLAEDDNA